MFCVKDNASNKSFGALKLNCEFMGEHISSLPNFVKLSTSDSTGNLSQQAIVRGPLKRQAQNQTKP